MVRILLACGIGASSGFIAAKMKKYAKKQSLDVTVQAVSKSAIEDFKGKFDILLLGPHFSAELPKYKNLYETENVSVMKIDPEFYATLNGEGVIKAALESYRKSEV